LIVERTRHPATPDGGLQPETRAASRFGSKLRRDEAWIARAPICEASGEDTPPVVGEGEQDG
jgi:hypothetical protein